MEMFCDAVDQIMMMIFLG